MSTLLPVHYERTRYSSSLVRAYDRLHSGFPLFIDVRNFASSRSLEFTLSGASGDGRRHFHRFGVRALSPP